MYDDGHNGNDELLYDNTDENSLDAKTCFYNPLPLDL